MMMPTVVLVAGAWTSPTAYHKLIGALEEKGFTVHIPALPTNNGQQPPDSTFRGDIEAACQQVQPLVVDNGCEVIMLMHSYSGIAGTRAVKGLSRSDRRANGLPGGVVHLVYLAAFLLGEGQTIRTVVQATNFPGRSSLVQFSSDNSAWFPVDPVWLPYQDLSHEDQQEQARD